MLKTNFENFIKRSRPLLGTFFSITFNEKNAHLITAAFEEAKKLEALFSLFDPQSQLSQYNASIESKTVVQSDPLLTELIDLAKKTYYVSNGAFDPFISSGRPSAALDLGGIAKGFVVDKVSLFLLNADPNFEGVVEAGGDLRFLNRPEAQSHIRCGSLSKPFLKTVKVSKPAVAVSSLSVSLECGISTSFYSKSLARGLQPDFAVVTNADECWKADAFTKVVLFSKERSLIERCAQQLEVEFLVLDEQGQVLDKGPS